MKSVLNAQSVAMKVQLPTVTIILLKDAYKKSACTSGPSLSYVMPRLSFAASLQLPRTTESRPSSLHHGWYI